MLFDWLMIKAELLKKKNTKWLKILYPVNDL
jgi:hypothetical protein